MFLHPVNVRCLVREYGSLEQSPEWISATVVEIAGYSMSEVRKGLPVGVRGGGGEHASSSFKTGRVVHTLRISFLGLSG